MNLNRDLAILFVSSHFPSWRQLRLSDPMTGSGIRAARYALEATNVGKVVASDRDTDAVELAEQTVRLNMVEGKVSVILSEAHTHLSNQACERFDLIDLDPFGSPAPFFESSLRATADGGVLAATATDMGPLSGARPAACIRKYGVFAIRTEFEKEMAIRAMGSCMASIGARLELGISVAFSHASDHYARLYAAVAKGRKAANESLRKLGFILYCPKCLTRTTSQSLSSIRTHCENCSSVISIGGPIWLGPLWNSQTVTAMVQNTPTLVSNRLSEIQKMLSSIQAEADSAQFYYTTDATAAKFGTKPPSIPSLLAALTENGYQASRTHFNPSGFRTDAPVKEIATLFRAISNKA